MIDVVRKILKKPCENVSAITEVDLYSKKINFLEHAMLLVQSAISHEDLTDISMDNHVSKSQISKLDTRRPYQVFLELFYDLIYPYIMAHNYAMYRRFLNIIGIDSTFIRTAIKESGKYRRQKTESGIKMHHAAVVFPFTLPIESLVTPANLNDSPGFDEIIGSIDPDLLKGSILTFDLGYYDLDRFMDLKSRKIRFVTRIKKNASYEVVKKYAHSRIVRFRNGVILRLVSIYVDGEQKDYLTDIMDLPDFYIHCIYSQRWNIEIFFRTMKSYLRIDHLISRNVNGILIQIFSALIAYVILRMIQDMISCRMGIPDLIRMIRHGIVLPFRKSAKGGYPVNI
ncbi:IS4 family transposase [Thermoplasma sp. Kam2015]|uniref:IS4 family transposase n=1 Tax=Thermoplasma sp. Kam2015 TaxID=2094122 RepID=UPI000D83D348|nr:IS4 family transposase [Thermoplasma sp. Kam2015]PYB68298.1 IS4 family transposase [Thermoplasma sp. Kam2015]